MITLPVNDCWQRHEMEMAMRDFQWPRRQSQFGRRARNRFQARAIGRRVTELPDSRQAYFATKMPADHSETCGTAIHLVDLHDVIDLSNALAVLAEQTSLVGERLFLAIEVLENLGVRRGLLAVELNLSCTCVSAGSSSFAKSSGTRASLFAS